MRKTRQTTLDDLIIRTPRPTNVISNNSPSGFYPSVLKKRKTEITSAEIQGSSSTTNSAGNLNKTPSKNDNINETSDKPSTSKTPKRFPHPFKTEDCVKSISKTTDKMGNLCAGGTESRRKTTNSSNTTYMYDRNTVNVARAGPIPYPSEKRDLWDDKHVRMPNSSKSKIDDKLRWNIICDALNTKWTNINDVIASIASYNHRMEAPNNEGKQSSTRGWRFAGLRTFHDSLSEVEKEKLLTKTLPKMGRLALRLDHLFNTSPPMLFAGNAEQAVSFSQEQCACLLANAFFCTFPQRNSTNGKFACFPFINFNRLLSSSDNCEKIKCIIHYFDRVTSSMPTGVITFQRVIRSSIEWDKSINNILPLKVELDGRIEDTQGNDFAMVDFANEYLGGGVLGRGCVQEEILFVIYPECLIGLLIAEKMDNNEAIVIKGIERYSNYTGYASTFVWTEDHIDKSIYDSSGHRPSEMLAIDATVCMYTNRQYNKDCIDRELNKAYVGFSATTKSKIATGNWGCGAFGGDKYLKALLQLVAASNANKSLIFYTFDDERLTSGLKEISNWLIENKFNAGQLYSAILACGVSPGEYILKRVRHHLLNPDQGEKLGENSLRTPPKEMSPCSDDDIFN